MDSWRAVRRDAQDGYTLIELIVAMTIFTIFTTVFISAVVGFTRGVTRTQVSAETTSSVLIVFQNLDRQVRYADAINTPGSGASGDRYIEFRTPATSADGAVAVCDQWRFEPATGTISSRRWNDQAGSVPTAWATKMTNAAPNAAADYPFGMLDAGENGATKQRLVLTINAGQSDNRTSISTALVARNSSSASSTVCQIAGLRP